MSLAALRSATHGLLLPTLAGFAGTTALTPEHQQLRAYQRDERTLTGHLLGDRPSKRLAR